MKTLMMKMCIVLFLLVFLLSSCVVSGLKSVVSKYQFDVTWHHSSWEWAQSYCRRYYVDLATISSESDLNQIHMRGYFAWIGLHRTQPGSWPWRWSSGPDQSGLQWVQNELHDNDMCACVGYRHRKFYGHPCHRPLFFFCDINATVFNKRYIFVPESKTWEEAKKYCEDKYITLGTFNDTSYQNYLTTQNYQLWIGLHRDAGGTWNWSTGASSYTNWEGTGPSNQGDCVSISSQSRKMSTHDCLARLPFVCFRDNLVLVKENKTWEEALQHCRALGSQNDRYDLISVQPGDDHRYIMSRMSEAETEEVWVGLRFLAGYWLWVNKADMSYPGLPSCPSDWRYCGALSKDNADTVETRECDERRNFMCYKKSASFSSSSSAL